MALRLIELILPENELIFAQDILKNCQALGTWNEKLQDNKILIRILLPAEKTEEAMDIFEKHFSTVEGFRIMLFPVEASIPRPEQPEEKPPGPVEEKPEQQHASNIGRISREELYNDVEDSTKITKIYFIMVALSSIVAAIGLLRSNVAITIGAMVIAPLIGPNVALSLATTLGDICLTRNSLKTLIAGILTAFIISASVGFILAVNPEIPEIASRTVIGLGDIILALAAGSAGALAFTTGIPTTLIGVMVAVALLPPLVTCGMLVGAGYWQDAFNALLLVLTNIICINLAGVITFMLQGIKPLAWWEADKAEKATKTAITLWVLLLLTLLLIVVISQHNINWIE
jgi:uncharacterized hydrophobic protein (TIGR00341 family)